MRFLVDTNIFLDFILKREKADEAANFFKLSRGLKHEIFITAMTLRDIGYITHRYNHNKELSLFAQMTAYQLSTKVVDTSADDAISSLYEETDDYEDALQIEAAKNAMVDAIITNNKKDFKKAGIPCYDVAFINKLMMQQYNINN